MISAGDDRRLQDASFLGGLKKLDEISLFDIDLQNLDFLRQLSEGKSLLMRLELGGNVADYSGLESFDTYSTLHVNMYNRGSADQIAPYLEGKKINDLNLANLDQVDLSQLPQPTQRLELANCGISDLTSVPCRCATACCCGRWKDSEVRLRAGLMARLRSLARRPMVSQAASPAAGPVSERAALWRSITARDCLTGMLWKG